MIFASRIVDNWPRWAALVVLLVACCAGGCKTSAPSNARQWRPEHTLTSYAVFRKDSQIELHNVRNCSYLSSDTFVLDYQDQSFSLGDIQSVDFVVMPFNDRPELAHTMLSFSLAGGGYLGVSVEIRKEVGESYDPLKGLLNEYELIYIIGEERDLLTLRACHQKSEVFIYPTKATPEQSQELFQDILKRTNRLAAQPEYYNTITNNCTVNLARHVNNLFPKRVPNDLSLLLTGYSPELAYNLGLLEGTGSFVQVQEYARAEELIRKYEHDPDFSRKIRLDMLARRQGIVN